MSEESSLHPPNGRAQSYSVASTCKIKETHETAPGVSSHLVAQVDTRWRTACEQRDATLYDGTLYSVIDIAPEEIKVARSSYRFFFAQAHDTSLFSELLVRPLAITAVLTCTDGFVFGRRSGEVAFDRNLWELGPSGTIDDTAKALDGHIDYCVTIRQELEEELGLKDLPDFPGRISAVVEDTNLHTVDLAVPVDIDFSGAEIRTAFASRSTTEYSDIEIVPQQGVRAFVNDHSTEMTPVCLQILSDMRLI